MEFNSIWMVLENNIWYLIAIGIAFALGTVLSNRNGGAALRGAIQDLQGQEDQVLASARQTRQDVAGLYGQLNFTNGLLSAILFVLIMQFLKL